MLSKAYSQLVTIVAAKRNAYGDIVPDTSTLNKQVYCRFRVESTATRVNNREELRSDQAMCWFPPTAPVGQHTMVLYEGRYWEVIKIVEARRMGSTRIEFLKVWVNAHDMVS